MPEDLRSKAILALPFAEYTSFVNTDEDGVPWSDLSCSRCLPNRESTVVRSFHLENMDRVLEAMLKHGQQYHGGIPVT